MATTVEYGLGDFTFPRGWFMVADSDELGATPLALRFFDCDLALYRAEAAGWCCSMPIVHIWALTLRATLRPMWSSTGRSRATPSVAHITPGGSAPTANATTSPTTTVPYRRRPEFGPGRSPRQWVASSCGTIRRVESRITMSPCSRSGAILPGFIGRSTAWGNCNATPWRSSTTSPMRSTWDRSTAPRWSITKTSFAVT